MSARFEELASAVTPGGEISLRRRRDPVGEVIAWHEHALLPGAEALTADPRTRLVHGDFFALVADDAGLDPVSPGRHFHAVLVDIDHSPRKLLDPSHASFYTVGGLRLLTRHLKPEGVFALWSDDPPDDDFLGALDEAFAVAGSHAVTFPNPYTGGESANTIYVARRA